MRRGPVVRLPGLVLVQAVVSLQTAVLLLVQPAVLPAGRAAAVGNRIWQLSWHH